MCFADNMEPILQFASKRLKIDREIVLAVKNGSIVHYASNDLQHDKIIILYSITNNNGYNFLMRLVILWIQNI